MKIQLIRRLYRGEYNSVWATSNQCFRILPTEEYNDSSWGKKYENNLLGTEYPGLYEALVNLVFVEKDALEKALKEVDEAAKEEQKLIELEYNME